MKTKLNKKLKLIIYLVMGLIVLGFAVKTFAATPEQYGLKEGQLIRATGDNDIFIVNQFGFKRLFLNPAIFNMYGHLNGGWAGVKAVTPAVRDAFVTSGYYRPVGQDKIYLLSVTGEDTGALTWVNETQEQFLSHASVNQVFTINENEFAWYGNSVAGNSANMATISANNLVGQTVPSNASGVKMLSVDFKGTGPVNSLIVKRVGFQPATSYQDIFLYKNGVRVDDPATFSGTDNNFATFNNLALTAPFTLDVVVNFKNAVVGSPAQVQLQGTYPGLPLTSNQFLFANVAGSTVAFGSVATVDDVVIGQSNAKLGDFKLTVPADDESITVRAIQLRNYGSADISNVKIVVDGVTYGALNLGDDKYLFITNFTITDGKSKRVLVYGDVSTNADAGDTIKFRLEKSYDITAIGNVYGFGVGVSGAGAYLDEVVVLDGGTLTASSVTNKPVLALWEESGISLFSFKLKATDESFSVSELGFAVNEDYIKTIYVYDGSTMVGSETVDGNMATISANFTLTGEKTLTVKADFVKQDTINSGSFVPKLVQVNATGTGSDDDVTWSGAISGKAVYVYPSMVSISSTPVSGVFTPSVSKKVFTFDVVAFGGDVKLASGSPLVVLGVETSGAPVATAWELKNGSTVVASGSQNFNLDNTLNISLDAEVDDIVLGDGESVTFSLYLNTVGFSGTNRYVGVMLDNVDGVVSWLGKDVDGEWLSTQFTSVKDILQGLPTGTSEFSE
jgi:hypothetical protein